ncbi:MAG: YeaH/YhbH family protein [Gammaproteobacteria bacterium]|nr:YeaH/YhbH family protein [Gammaproteobacteria bacterium]
MSYVVDRRLNGKNKSTVNRQRFLHRYRKHIKKAVDEAVTKRSITDLDSGESISIPRRDISEPHFHHTKGGKREIIHPGNKEFVSGDRVPRPQGGGGAGGSGSGDPSNSGEGIDEFVFQISQDEFLDFLFEDLELPNLVKRQLQGIESFKYVRAGVVNDGNPAKINIVRSMRQATSRRIALGASAKRRLRAAEEQLKLLQEQDSILRDKRKEDELENEIIKLRRRINKIPFIDTIDLRYNLHMKQPKPTSKAVMFCLMDVSGSMNQAMKDMAKRFFILLYMFLKRNYEKIEVVFIRHHTSAKEVDEEEFFYSRETGGTIVSSALKMMRDIIVDRYPTEDWNIYGAQASDGDNWNDDSPTCREILMKDILPRVQYYSYIEINPRRHQALWREYEAIEAAVPHFSMQQISEPGDIYPVFRELFQRRPAHS